MKTLKFTTAFLIMLLGVSTVNAQELPDRPTPPRLVVDFTGILAPSEVSALENKLVRFNDTTSNQILIVITDDLLNYTPETYASGIGDKWGVGQSEFDNGVVVLVKPKIGNNRGQAFISVGYGLTGAIPDITAGQIVDREMIPYFKQNDYYGGLDAATTVLMELAAGEYNSDEYARQDKGWWSLLPFGIILFIIILASRLTHRSRTMGSKSMSPWAAFWLGSMIGSSGSSWGRSSGGGFGGGGGGGSSFGGFGGGGFGGGGAGGSW